MNDNVIIRTEGVQKYYKGGEIKALDGVSASIHIASTICSASVGFIRSPFLSTSSFTYSHNCFALA